MYGPSIREGEGRKGRQIDGEISMKVQKLGGGIDF